MSAPTMVYGAIEGHNEIFSELLETVLATDCDANTWELENVLPRIQRGEVVIVGGGATPLVALWMDTTGEGSDITSSAQAFAIGRGEMERGGDLYACANCNEQGKTHGETGSPACSGGGAVAPEPSKLPKPHISISCARCGVRGGMMREYYLRTLAEDIPNLVCCKSPDPSTGLPPDPDGQNEERAAAWAGVALAAFMEETGADEEDAICDLLADLRHWCDRNGERWAEVIDHAMKVYEAETTEGGAL